MTAKTKTGFISFCTFCLFFIVGWKLGLSPVWQSLDSASYNIKFVKQQLFGLPQVEIPSNYISENQYKIDVLHYSLTFDLYPDKKLLIGEAKIKGLFKKTNMSKLDLNLYDNMNINYLTLNGEEVPYIHKGTRLSISINKDIADTFVVEIHYEGTPKRIGLSSFVFGEKDNRSVIYNLSEPTYSSTWFPCNDIPDDKALADIYIINDSVYTSVSNGILSGEDFINEKKRTHWKILYPISTYLISVYSSEYIVFKDYYYSEITSDTLPLEYYVFPEHLNNAKADFEEHPQMMDYFSKTFGEYPFMDEKYGVAEFLWQFGAMEHQTITGIGSNFINGRKFFTDIYVHELAHHWWGNAVGPKSWKDIWLNEGFATYSEALYNESKGGSDALQSTMLSKFQTNFIGKLYNPGDDLFNQTIYDKGAWVLHMLRWEVGDSNFFKILRNYFERYKYKSASTDDFKSICEELYEKDLTKFFNQWVYDGDDQIKVNIEWKISNVVNSIITVELNFIQIQDRYKEFHFPFEIRFSDNLGNNLNKTFYIDETLKTIYYNLKFEPDTIIVDPNHWLLGEFNLKEKNGSNND